MDSFPLHLPPIYYIYYREISPVDSTRVNVHCRCTHTNAILKAQLPRLIRSLQYIATLYENTDSGTEISNFGKY